MREYERKKNIVDVHPTSPIENRVLLLLFDTSYNTKVYTDFSWYFILNLPTYNINTSRLIHTGDFKILLYSRITQQLRNLRLKTRGCIIFINVQYIIYTCSRVVHVYYRWTIVHSDENNICT